MTQPILKAKMLHNFWTKFSNLGQNAKLQKNNNILTSYVQGLSSSISGHLVSTFSNLCLKLCPL
jgi:hypothetical protein